MGAVGGAGAQWSACFGYLGSVLVLLTATPLEKKDRKGTPYEKKNETTSLGERWAFYEGLPLTFIQNKTEPPPSQQITHS